jgi:hypothetical protein
MKFNAVPTLGTPPENRWAHSMIFNRQLNVLVLFGGIVDTLNK